MTEPKSSFWASTITNKYDVISTAIRATAVTIIVIAYFYFSRH